MSKTNEINENLKDYEKCVICGTVTDVKYDTPLVERKEYIEGTGQLCRKCYFETFVKNSK